MRDNFYHWLIVALLFAMFFGAEVARAEMGRLDLFLIVAYGAIGVMATVGAVDSYRRDRAAPTPPGEGARTEAMEQGRED